MIVHRTKSWHSGHFLLWGFALWLIATIVFHYWGNLLIDTKHPFRTGLSFAVAFPLIFGCVAPLFSFLKVPISDRTRRSVQIALPGMLMDIISILYHDVVFPVISEQSIPLLAAWLFWAYGLILIVGLGPMKFRFIKKKLHL
ncbi:MAG: DUF5367 domain-containing protein [Paenibacillus lautus]|jgi:uncharacterized membrane protein YecN with MAPEG domain|uniref:DUF5367 family protein n=1 Tax=Paenibacillus lautus TaxID=1401 RepID=UPI0026EF7FDB|nr:DUF5367 family protein [Paenibacillus lautus]MCI1776198.1 DUF5367 domain-containing protein [Paenibacillus lautus]